MLKVIAVLLGIHAAEAQSLQSLAQITCSNRAAEIAKDRGGVPGIDTKFIFDYESHYNSRLQKCFFLEITTMINREGETKLMLLRDLFEKEELGPYGGLVKKGGSEPSVCSVLLIEPVQQRQCRSEQEWRELIKPYM
jgi:hypothetical protein